MRSPLANFLFSLFGDIVLAMILSYLTFAWWGIGAIGLRLFVD